MGEAEPIESWAMSDEWFIEATNMHVFDELVKIESLPLEHSTTDAGFSNLKNFAELKGLSRKHKAGGLTTDEKPQRWSSLVPGEGVSSSSKDQTTAVRETTEETVDAE